MATGPLRSMGVALALSLLAASCTDDGPAGKDLSSNAPSPTGTSGVDGGRNSVVAEGSHGLRVSLAAPNEVRGGEIFQIEVEVTDDRGGLDHLEITFGDEQPQPQFGYDVVCPNGRRPTQRQTTMEHAYRSKGTYTIAVTAVTGTCTRPMESAVAELEVEVSEDAEATNGPFPPRAKIGHAYYTDGNEEVLVSDIGGYDADGYVAIVEIDWGDGSDPVLVRRSLVDCSDGSSWPEGWMSEPTRHRYSRAGNYLVTVEVTSFGCDGKGRQTDKTTRTLEFPPIQGS